MLRFMLEVGYRTRRRIATPLLETFTEVYCFDSHSQLIPFASIAGVGISLVADKSRAPKIPCKLNKSVAALFVCLLLPCSANLNSRAYSVIEILEFLVAAKSEWVRCIGW